MPTAAKSIHIVYAQWCPHCEPLTIEPILEAAAQLGVPCKVHDIDTDDVKAADDLVRNHGDWSPDYLVPQVFVELTDGEIRHVLTGDPRGLDFTRRAIEGFLKGGFYESLKAAIPAKEEG